MGGVAVVGAGMTRFATSTQNLSGMFHEAFRDACASVDKGFAAADVEEAWSGSLGFGGAQLGHGIAAGVRAHLERMRPHRLGSRPYPRPSRGGAAAGVVSSFHGDMPPAMS